MQIGTNTMNRIVFIGIAKDRRCFISILYINNLFLVMRRVNCKPVIHNAKLSKIVSTILVL
jgi:hypothetical protein